MRLLLLLSLENKITRDHKLLRKFELEIVVFGLTLKNGIVLLYQLFFIKKTNYETSDHNTVLSEKENNKLYSNKTNDRNSLENEGVEYSP